MRRNTIQTLASLLFLGLLAPAASFAQLPISFGIKGGWPLSYALSDTGQNADGSTRSYSTSREFIVGPMVELRLPLRFSVEADALYHPFDVTLASQYTELDASHTIWEFPILAKYHFGGRLLSPYVGAGPEFRTRPGDSAITDIPRISGNGFVMAAGLEFKLKIIRVSPEIRYTRWGSDGDPRSHLVINSNQNQTAFLVGLTF